MKFAVFLFPKAVNLLLNIKIDFICLNMAYSLGLVRNVRDRAMLGDMTVLSIGHPDSSVGSV